MKSNGAENTYTVWRTGMIENSIMKCKDMRKTGKWYYYLESKKGGVFFWGRCDKVYALKIKDGKTKWQ